MADPANGDYSLVSGSPAWGYGCQTFRALGCGASTGSIDSRVPLPRPDLRSDRRDEITVSGSITEDTVWNADKVNVVHYGGALFFYHNACPRIADNLIVDNHSLDNGSAVYCAYSYPVLTNNTIVNNTIHNSDDPYIDSCAVLSFLAKPQLVNNIIRDNDPEFVYLHTQLWSNKAYYTRYNNIEDHEEVGGNIDADPLFVDEADSDYHLTHDSPCRDSGDSSAAIGAADAAIGTADFEGDPRVAGDSVDMGADEFYFHLYAIGPVAAGSPIDVKIVGCPGMPTLLGLGGAIADPPLATQHGDLWLTLPLFNSWALGPVPQTGVRVFSTTVPAGWLPGEQYPFQALVGAWSWKYTKLTNLMLLTAE